MSEPPYLSYSALSYLYGVAVAGVLAYFLLGLPIQLTDSFTLLVDAQHASLWRLMTAHVTEPAYMRPLLWAQTRIVYLLARGNYYAWFRGLHAVQGAVLILLFIRLLRPRTAIDAAIVPLAVAVLIGIHTFQGTVREAFPINTFMTILLCCVMAANLVFAARSRWVDAAAVLLLLFAAFTVESGLLVWVIFVVAWVSGARGLSRTGMLATTGVVLAYFVLRFAVFHVGAPALIERSSGFGFRALDPPELIRRFGAHPLRFYAYNVITSVVSVLFAEPRAGIWTFTRSVVQSGWRLSLAINIVASTCATGLIAAYVWRRRRSWLAWQLDRHDQLVILFIAILGANAAISYAYTKDVIMSPAGVFFAAAVYVAAHDLVVRMPAVRTTTVSAAVAVCLVLSATWAVRATGTFVALRHQVFNVRSDWAEYDRFATGNNVVLDPAATALKNHLQREAIARAPRSTLVGHWTAIFDID